MLLILGCCMLDAISAAMAFSGCPYSRECACALLLSSSATSLLPCGSLEVPMADVRTSVMALGCMAVAPSDMAPISINASSNAERRMVTMLSLLGLRVLRWELWRP